MSEICLKLLDKRIIDRKPPKPFPFKPQKPYIPPKPREEKKMTIAAGFKCENGLVMATDTELTNGSFKTHGGKGSLVKFGEDCVVAVVAAGYYDYLALACEEICEASYGRAAEEIKHSIKTAIYEIYSKHIHPFFPEQESAGVLQVLVGIVVPGDIEPVSLLRSYKSILREAGPYDFVGAGESVARFLMGRKKTYSWPPIKEVSKTAFEIISTVKKNVPSCGGGTNLWQIREDGEYETFHRKKDLLSGTL